MQTRSSGEPYARTHRRIPGTHCMGDPVRAAAEKVAVFGTQEDVHLMANVLIKVAASVFTIMASIYLGVVIIGLFFRL